MLEAVDSFIRDSGRCVDALEWLKGNPNALLGKAYRAGNMEQIFTILDLAETFFFERLVSEWKAGKAKVTNHTAFDSEIEEYRRHRKVLLSTVEAYFLQKHQQDRTGYDSPDWDNLKTFGQILEPHDVVITFNYDSTVERVLREQGKWSPADGYAAGTELLFQRGPHDQSPVKLPPSPSEVTVIHLHGAIGWYKKAPFRSGYEFSGSAGAFPQEALAPAQLAEISLDPLLLQGFGILAVDASMPERPTEQDQILLHPSFLKDFEGRDTGHNEVFTRMWRVASEAIRAAEEVIVIGYSLPPADTAAWTLFITACDPKKTTIVNRSPAATARYGKISSLPLFRSFKSFEEWLKSHLKAGSCS
ncbi:MAG TPA: hypothetical protein VII95_07830 [Terriglobales bacterium]